MNPALGQLGEAVQSFLAVNGQLSINYYKQFWTSLRDRDNAANYIAILLAKLVAMTTGEDRHVLLTDIVTKIVAGEPSIVSPADITKLPSDHDANVDILFIFLLFSICATVLL